MPGLDRPGVPVTPGDDLHGQARAGTGPAACAARSPSAPGSPSSWHWYLL